MAMLGIKDARRFAQVYLKTMDAEQAAAAIGAKNGATLLECPEVTCQLDAQRAAMKAQLRQEDVLRAAATLAFGRSNDCVRLVLDDAPEVDRLDLRLLAEIKRNEKGTVEIKLVDRLRALEMVQALVGGTSPEAESFLRAMSGVCQNG